MNYQDKVKEAFEILEDAKIQVFTALINVAMVSEFKEIDELFDEGEFFCLQE